MLIYVHKNIHTLYSSTMVVKASADRVVHQKLKLQLQMIILNYGNLQITQNLLKIILKTVE